MASIRTLDILLDTLASGEESLLAPRPTSAIARSVPVARVVRDGSRVELPVAEVGDRTAQAEASAPRPSDLPPGAASPQSKVTGAPADGTSVIRPAYVETPSASLELSATAQWLQKSLLTVGSRDAAASIRASQPLLPDAPRDTEPLAQALSASIAQSGLFYESHLADWVVQRYPESLLRREPQARWGGDADHAHDEAHPIRDLADGAAVAAPSTAHDGSRASVDLLRAQLQALESRQFSWQGELWPGQAAALTITDEAASTAPHLPSTWRTRITLTTPELGEIDVDVRLSGSSLELDIAAADARSVELLANGRRELVSALEARAHSVASVTFRQS